MSIVSIKRKRETFMLQNLFRHLLVLLFFSLSSEIYAGAPKTVPGFINLNENPFSSDLVHEGTELSESEYDSLANSGFDTSDLNPKSKYWENRKFSLKDQELNISGNELYFSEIIPSQTGEVWFNASSAYEKFELVLSKKSHNILLRTALMAKLGYKVPQVKFLKDITINFPNAKEMEDFLSSLSSKTLVKNADKRWVIGKNETQVTFKDVVAMESGYVTDINFSLGLMHYTRSKNNRAVNAALVPFELIDIPASINALEWHMGLIIENNFVLDYYMAKEFSTTRDDLYWISKRLGDLSRKDFSEIVKFGNLPQEVELLLVEKLLSRRNSLLKQLNLPDSKDKVNVRISKKPILVKGKLIEEEIKKVEKKQPWVNYITDFTYGDFENPINYSRIKNYFKAEGISASLSKLLDTFHTEFPLGTDISSELSDKYREAIFRNLVDFVETGEYKEINVGTVTIPYLGINLHGSRDVLIGGKSDENVSLTLSQSFGYSLGAGVFGITDSLPSRMNLKGKVEARVQRMFTNLRPLEDVNQLNEQPLIDILVNWHKRSFAKSLDAKVNKNSIQDIKEFVGEIKNNLKIGESLMITDSLNFTGLSNLIAPINPTVMIGNTLFKNNAILRRTNIVRSSENTIQIYKGISDIDSFSLGFSAYAKNIPALSINWGNTSGVMNTDFYEMNLTNATEVELLNFLNFFKENEIEYLANDFKKANIKHEFDVSSTNVNFFFWRNTNTKGENTISITRENGQKHQIFRKFKERVSGRNMSFFVSSLFNLLYQDRSYLSYDLEGLLSKIADKFGKDDYKVRTEYQNEGNIEDTAEVLSENSFLQIHYNWNGFRDSSNDIVQKMNKVNSEFKDRVFFPVDQMNSTTSVLYYNMNKFFNVYQSSIKHLFSLKEQEYEKLFNLHRKNRIRTARLKCGSADTVKECLWNTITYYKKRIKKQDGSYSFKQKTDYLIRLVGILHKSFKLEGLIHLFGEKNIYVFGGLSGIRYGDEMGLVKDITANTIGSKSGKKYPFGPLQYIYRRSGISFTELYLNWL